MCKFTGQIRIQHLVKTELLCPIAILKGIAFVKNDAALKMLSLKSLNPNRI